MIPNNLHFNSFMPPVLIHTMDKTFVCPGWVEVPNNTTINEVYSKWTQKGIESLHIHTHMQTPKEFKVKSSKGDKEYTITHNSNGWKCTCSGYEFRRNCKHINDLKTKNYETN